MKRFVTTLVMSGLIGGCSSSPPQTPEADTAAAEPRGEKVETPPAMPAPVPPQEPPALSEAVYPEHAEVQRLLFRARELERQHEYLGALALVNQALAVDPHSPTAAGMQGRLEEIIRKMQRTG